jgi:hypothetical protein
VYLIAVIKENGWQLQMFHLLSTSLHGRLALLSARKVA